MRHFDRAIESVEHSARVFPDGDPDTVLIAFRFPKLFDKRYAECGASGGLRVTLL